MASGSKLASGVKIVAEVGKAVQLPSEGASVSVVVQALYTNEGRIVVGGEKVKAKEGTHGTPEQAGIGLEKGQYASFDLIDPGAIYFDATKAGDGVAFTVLYT